MKPRLLVVPHIYADDITVREIELARRLTRFFDVFVLKWRDALHVDASSATWRRLKQVFVATQAALRTIDSSATRNGVTLVKVPVLQPILLRRFIGAENALKLCSRRNARTLRTVLRELKITHLLLANEVFGVERISGIRMFHDVVDWFPEEQVGASQLQKIREKLRSIAANADAVFAVSQPLSEKLLADCGIRAIPLPNGADISRLRSVDPVGVRVLRANLGLEGKFVIGYIGNHGTYTGVDLVVNAFLAAKAIMPDSVLLIVGPAEPWRALLDTHRKSGVIATGSVPPEQIATYFNALDLGVLAQGISAGTNFAFQIKVVEYTACRKCVVSTPLATWKRMAWPNVILAEPTVEAWKEAFIQARAMKWRPEWDRLAEAYDWAVLAEAMGGVMLGEGAT
ncbi:MAG TPA: glycosyltransferase family 4 protein [Candidatus Acidoferrum sp.]